MKLSKKVLAAFSMVAALAVAGTFVGCSEDDDPYEMIEEVNSSKWTINHTNNDADKVHRGYKSTNFKHAGGLVNIHFDGGKTTSADGVMGIIFGLRNNSTDKNKKDFYVVGVRNKGDYYISAFKLVSDLQADNFGAVDSNGNAKTISSLTDFNSATECTEWEIADFTTVPSSGESTSDGYDVGIYFRDVVVDTEKDSTTNTYTHKYEIYFVQVDTTAKYDVDDSTGTLKVKAADASDYSEVSLGKAVASIEYESDSSSVSQYKFAPYANVYPNKDNCSESYTKITGTGTVKGTWTVPADYKHADVEADF